MHVLSITSVFLATAILSSATPTGTSNLVPRACTTVYPALIDLIDQQNPTVANPSTNVEVALNDVAGTLYHRDALVRFDNIPAGSYACQLEAYFPAAATITQSGSTLVDVFSVDRNALATDTYAVSPQRVGIFGTLTFQSSATQPTKQVINSAACSPSLTYRLAISSQTAVGDVNFVNTAAAQGLQITFNC